MRAHAFITNEDTFPVVRDNSFCGVGTKGIPNTLDSVIRENLKDGRKKYFAMLSDILGTRIGDIKFEEVDH